MEPESMTHEDLLKAYKGQEEEIFKLSNYLHNRDGVINDLSNKLAVSERMVDSIIAKKMNGKPRIVGFKIVNLSKGYKPAGFHEWIGADEFIEHLVSKGFELYGKIQQTDIGPIQAMIKYENQEDE